MKEAGVVVGRDNQVISWHAPDDRTGGSLPDSRSLWAVLWEHRADVIGFAHTHPGVGVPAPSWTDITTFAAIEKGLGRRLCWWIASADQLIIVAWVGPHEHEYKQTTDNRYPPWIGELRRLSRYERT